jgi:hypothetical protein
MIRNLGVIDAKDFGSVLRPGTESESADYAIRNRWCLMFRIGVAVSDVNENSFKPLLKSSSLARAIFFL